MRITKLKLLRIFLVIFGLSLVVYGFYGIGRKTGLVGPSVPPQKAAWEQYRRENIAIIEKKGALEHEVLGALLRLASRQDAYARTEGLKRSVDPSPHRRETAVSILAKYEDAEVAEALKKLMRDETPKVRLATIAYLAVEPGTFRENLLTSSISELGRNDQIAAYSSLVRMTPDPEKKKEYVGRILNYARQKSGKEDDGAVLAEALFGVMAAAPKDRAVLETLRWGLSSGRLKKVLGSSIVSHLGLLGDSWLRTNLSVLSKDSDLEIKKAAVGMVSVLCPEGRWDILERAAAAVGEPAVTQVALREALAVGGPRAKALAGRLSKNSAASPELSEIVKRLEKSNGEDRCLEKSRKKG